MTIINHARGVNWATGITKGLGQIDLGLVCNY